VSDYGLGDRAIEDFSSSLCFQTSSGANPASYPKGTGGPFLGSKERPGRDGDRSPPSSAEVVNDEELYILSPCACIGVLWDCFSICFYRISWKWFSCRYLKSQQASNTKENKRHHELLHFVLHIVLRFLQLNCSVFLQLTGMNRVECWMLSNVSTNTEVAIFKVNLYSNPDPPMRFVTAH